MLVGLSNANEEITPATDFAEVVNCIQTTPPRNRADKQTDTKKNVPSNKVSARDEE